MCHRVGRLAKFEILLTFVNVFLSIPAVSNPNRAVYLLVTSPVYFESYPASPIVSALLSYPNIQFKYFDVVEITKGTPMEKWITNSSLFDSYYLNVHLSDVFRLVILWKYSGIYLDLDNIVLQSFDDVPANFASVENETNQQIGSAVLGMQGDVGRKVLALCLQYGSVAFPSINLNCFCFFPGK